ncbi:MAG: type III pantothenate kinase [Saprospiraceae bacterium]|nr:type III pantothenate kinase [Candidatus Vicinibacter affinis]
MSYQTPETLGQDRIAALLRCLFLHPENNILLVNAGSCVTIDLLEANGTFLGGNIAPGMKMRWKAMHEFTGRLPLVEFAEVGDQVLGNDTTSALRLGVIKGILHEIRGYFTELHSKYSFLKMRYDRWRRTTVDSSFQNGNYRRALPCVARSQSNFNCK